MPAFKQDEIDQLSDGLKRASVEPVDHLPTIPIAGWFYPARDGPQFFTGNPSSHLDRIQPLYFTPAFLGQMPCAWRVVDGVLITRKREAYAADNEWRPLYLAREPAND